MKCQAPEPGSRYGAEHSFSDQGRPDSEGEIQYVPRASTPHAKSFSERKRVAGAETAFSKEPFSSGPFAGLEISSWFPILMLTLE